MYGIVFAPYAIGHKKSQKWYDWNVQDYKINGNYNSNPDIFFEFDQSGGK